VNNGEVVYWGSSVGTAHAWEAFDARAEPMTAAWIEQEVGSSQRQGALHRVGSLAFGRFDAYGAYVVRHTVVAAPVWLSAGLLPVSAWSLWRRRRRRGASRGFAVEVSTRGGPRRCGRTVPSDVRADARRPVNRRVS
jgi:hypothetical protein